MSERKQTRQQSASEDSAEAVLRSLRRILRAVDRDGRRLAHKHALTGPQFICLREIQRSGPVNPGQLARSVSLRPPTVTGILDRLELRGLVSRRRRHRDKRQVLVELAPAGVELLAQVPAPLQERFSQRLEALPETRRAELADALRTVVGLMEAEDIDAAPLLASGAANPAETKTPDETAVHGTGALQGAYPSEMPGRRDG